jgi:hypothetical protein
MRRNTATPIDALSIAHFSTKGVRIERMILTKVHLAPPDIMHDQNFKNLVLDYPHQALAFFAPQEAGPKIAQAHSPRTVARTFRRPLP